MDEGAPLTSPKNSSTPSKSSMGSHSPCQALVNAQTMSCKLSNAEGGRRLHAAGQGNRVHRGRDGVVLLEAVNPCAMGSYEGLLGASPHTRATNSWLLQLCRNVGPRLNRTDALMHT